RSADLRAGWGPSPWLYGSESWPPRPFKEPPRHGGDGPWPLLGSPTMSDNQRPDRNLAMELVRVTEAAALAASRWMGRGDKNGADGAAVDAMRLVLESVPMDGIVVIGEGGKDEGPMLYNGERGGGGSGPRA